uniref:Nuclear receptor domain-containing protein n=1 Tax=Panagrolaimus sp. ES5 TaxID=591445 RepID=A0AC34FVE2_9BILA
MALKAFKWKMEIGAKKFDASGGVLDKLWKFKFEGMMLCFICEQAQGLRTYGIVFCDSCLYFYKRSISNAIVYKCICKVKSDHQQPCKACRIQKCHNLKISSSNIKNIAPLAELGDETTQTFSELLENLIEVCNRNMILTSGYIIHGDQAVLKIATQKFVERKPSVYQTKYKQMWSGMLAKHKISWTEIPVILDLFLRYYYPEITKLVDPNYAAVNQEEHMKDLKGSMERLEHLHCLSQYLISAVLPAAAPLS